MYVDVDLHSFSFRFFALFFFLFMRSNIVHLSELDVIIIIVSYDIALTAHNGIGLLLLVDYP